MKLEFRCNETFPLMRRAVRRSTRKSTLSGAFWAVAYRTGRIGQTSRTNAMDLRERSFTSFVGELGFILQKRVGHHEEPDPLDFVILYGEIT
ncbi:hypothetical protein [Porphyromonas somerae]|uniref:hypothetical protein n=1 Tax=Porphyromonas somerae TaxID=322095 RepID=UPI002A7F1804|nr:hypothetical protein [Porphyromonas somerae]MDY3884970.1 hypothetical protein [Porphyromonas somerae]